MFPVGVYEKQVTPGLGAIFDPGSVIWTILLEVHKIELHTKYQRLIKDKKIF